MVTFMTGQDQVDIKPVEVGLVERFVVPFSTYSIWNGVGVFLASNEVQEGLFPDSNCPPILHCVVILFVTVLHSDSLRWLAKGNLKYFLLWWYFCCGSLGENWMWPSLSSFNKTMTLYFQYFNLHVGRKLVLQVGHAQSEQKKQVKKVWIN